ncbi:hypothetical protein EB796_020013 [Bugula neritina]|uniref:Uncharacterized protein n=1 Tax=Bugula neritina TaxID=10212 RepID=A0A7J7J7W9_BUGNE|nr:hypothetical protein EB796_020013 [Bugula neritina]
MGLKIKEILETLPTVRLSSGFDKLALFLYHREDILNSSQRAGLLESKYFHHHEPLIAVTLVLALYSVEAQLGGFGGGGVNQQSQIVGEEVFDKGLAASGQGAFQGASKLAAGDQKQEDEAHSDQAFRINANEGFKDNGAFQIIENNGIDAANAEHFGAFDSTNLFADSGLGVNYSGYVVLLHVEQCRASTDEGIIANPIWHCLTGASSRFRILNVILRMMLSTHDFQNKYCFILDIQLFQFCVDLHF